MASTCPTSQGKSYVAAAEIFYTFIVSLVSTVEMPVSIEFFDSLEVDILGLST